MAKGMGVELDGICVAIQQYCTTGNIATGEIHAGTT